MPALDFQTLLRQERNRVRHEMDQTNNKTHSGSPRAEESEEGHQHHADDKEDTTCFNFAARMDALLDSVMASHVQSAAPEDGDMDIMATAAAKVVEESKQVRHCLRARLNPEYLTRATTECDLSKHAMRGPPDGVFYVPEYISKEMEQEIMEVAHSMPVNHWVKLRGRRLQCFGGKPTENVRSFQSEALPPWIGQVCRTLMLAGVFDEEIIPNHVVSRPKDVARYARLKGGLYIVFSTKQLSCAPLTPSSIAGFPISSAQTLSATMVSSFSLCF